MRYAAADKDGAMFWAERGVGYVVSGGSDRDRLTKVAQAVYDQSREERHLSNRLKAVPQFRH